MKSYGPVNVLIRLSWPVGGSDCRKAKEPTRWCVDVFPGKKQWPWCSACCVSLSAGVNRHFHMICIRDKFSQNIGRQVSSSVIWDHLGTMYDMQALVRTHTHMLSVCYMPRWTRSSPLRLSFLCDAARVGDPAVPKQREELLPARWHHPGGEGRWGNCRQKCSFLKLFTPVQKS